MLSLIVQCVPETMTLALSVRWETRKHSTPLFLRREAKNPIAPKPSRVQPAQEAFCQTDLRIES